MFDLGSEGGQDGGNVMARDPENLRARRGHTPVGSYVSCCQRSLSPLDRGSRWKDRPFLARPFAALLALWAWRVTHQWFTTSDTQGVLLGAAAARRCLAAGHLFDCRTHGYEV